MKIVNLSRFHAKVKEALERAQKEGKKVYQNIGKGFLVNIKVPKKSHYSHFTTVDIEGYREPVGYYQTGFKGGNTPVLNLNLFGVSGIDIGKNKLFVCQLEVVALPDGRWFLGVKGVKKNDADYSKPFLTIDPLLMPFSEEWTIKVFDAISEGVKSPFVKIQWTKNQWKRMQQEYAV